MSRLVTRLAASALSLTLAFGALPLAALAEDDAPPANQDAPASPAANTYHVTFIDGLTKGSFAEQDVAAGQAATAPVPPSHEDRFYEFYGWSVPFDRVTEDLEVVAIYTAKEVEGEPIPAAAGDTARGIRYPQADGSLRVELKYEQDYPATGWQLVGGRWYYGGSGGVAVTGYVHEGETSYFCDADGTMHTGWFITASGKRNYCYQHSGAIAKSSWFHEGGVWYWADATGIPVTGWQWVGDAWYYFDPNSEVPGAMRTGWLYDGAWYYLSGDGVMLHSQFVLVDGVWYWLKGSGQMLTNSWQYDSGNWYYFGDDGAMYANRLTPDGNWVNANGVWVA